MPTHGSCRPFVTISTASPDRVIVSTGVSIDAVGLKATRTTTGCRLNIRAPELPIYSNVTSEPYPMGANARPEIIDLLSRQIAASVDWIGSVEHMYRDGKTCLLANPL